MFWDDEVTPEEEDEIIRKAAERIHRYGMDAAAIMMLESVKPLVYIGGQMGRFLISPFLLIFGEKVSIYGDKFFTIFEKRENVEKLIRLLEEMAEAEKGAQKREDQGAQQKKGWRRFLPF